jgi:hypothetical protein
MSQLPILQTRLTLIVDKVNEDARMLHLHHSFPNSAKAASSHSLLQLLLTMIAPLQTHEQIRTLSMHQKRFNTKLSSRYMTTTSSLCLGSEILRVGSVG